MAYLAGAVPFSQIVAKVVAKTDLREHGSGTVSGTGLFEVAGFGPLVVGGLLDVAKGAAGPWLAGERPLVAAVAVGFAVAGHNWSPFLGGRGGRGISPAMGGLAVVAWPGSVLLLTGLAVGKLAGQTGLGSFVAQALLVPLLAVIGVGHGAIAGACVVVPLWLKRVVGNRGLPRESRVRTAASRLLFDRDEVLGGPGDTGEQR